METTKGDTTAAEPNEEEIKMPFLQYKTWVLKVSLHCHGCCREVKKTLHQLHGVYDTEIDFGNKKVTVKGNMNLKEETLVKKLAKIGKMAEPWLEKRDHDDDQPSEEMVEEVEAEASMEEEETRPEFGCQTTNTPDWQENMARRCCFPRKEEQGQREFLTKQSLARGCCAMDHSRLHQLVPTMHAVSYCKACPKWSSSSQLFGPRHLTREPLVSDMEIKSSSEEDENLNMCSIN